MKLLESKIFDVLNSVVFCIQNKLDGLRQNSFILSNLDMFIMIAIFSTLFVSIFATTELIGIVSFSVPFLVVLKVLITKGEKIELERSNFYLLIYLAICLISNFTSSMIFQSLYGYMKTLIYFAFYFAMCQFLKQKKHYIFPIMIAIALLVSFECVVAIFQNYIGVANISTWQDTSYINPEDVLSRVYGTLKPYNPNLFAGYLIAGFPAVFGLFALALKKCKLKSTMFSLALVLISFLTIFLTGCRGAYIALFVILLAIALASFQIVFKDFDSKKLQTFR